jgi:hypothetical protein
VQGPLCSWFIGVCEGVRFYCQIIFPSFAVLLPVRSQSTAPRISARRAIRLAADFLSSDFLAPLIPDRMTKCSGQQLPPSARSSFCSTLLLASSALRRTRPPAPRSAPLVAPVSWSLARAQATRFLRSSGRS